MCIRFFASDVTTPIIKAHKDHDLETKNVKLSLYSNFSFEIQILCIRMQILYHKLNDKYRKSFVILSSREQWCGVAISMKIYCEYNLKQWIRFNIIKPKNIWVYKDSLYVHIFWEGHKILRNLHLTFFLCSASQILGEDFAKFCGLLRIYEL